MSLWSTRRKLSYLSIFIGAVVVFVGVPAFVFFYEAPSCFDGRKNQGEQGRDCGGPCRNLCQNLQVLPIVVWRQKFEVTPDVYSAVAYLENPNIGAYASKAAYKFTLYDDKGVVITERYGTTYIPPQKVFVVFEGGIQVGNRPPTRVEFEFVETPYWSRSSVEEPKLSIQSKVLSRTDVRPRLDAVVKNESIFNLANIEVQAIIYAASGNAIAASRTYIEELRKDESKNVVFTWTAPFPPTYTECEAPTDVMLVIDRSGSMGFDSPNPPQPLTDVKNAALAFVDQLKLKDQAGLVTFATEASQPIDSTLTGNFNFLKERIENVTIATNGTQHTNIADGLAKALQELSSIRHRVDSKKTIVLLIDGIASHPQKPGDERYPEVYAEEVAQEAKQSGVEIYAIGLGNDVNHNFLRSISSSPQHYYSASTGKNVATIYNQIAHAMCKQGPTVIEVIPIVYPQ
jgi:Mg-chelatase subunit ChlD